MSSIHASGGRRRAGARAVAATAFALGVAAAGYLVAGTGAQAINAVPAITANPPEPPEPPPPPPPSTRVPLPTVPQATLVLDPGPADAPSTTTSPTTTTATDTTEADTTTVAAATDSNDGNAAPAEYAVTVSRAEVGCDGIIRVEYNTVAIPEPPSAANHLVVFNPAANPADFHVVETTGNPANGSFAFEQAGQISATYRLFVVAAFDPVNPAGPLAVDQVEVLPAPGC